jgi:hypothetical protein
LQQFNQLEQKSTEDVLLLGAIGVRDEDREVRKRAGESLHRGGHEARTQGVGEAIVEERDAAFCAEWVRQYFRKEEKSRNIGGCLEESVDGVLPQGAETATKVVYRADTSESYQTEWKLEANSSQADEQLWSTGTSNQADQLGTMGCTINVPGSAEGQVEGTSRMVCVGVKVVHLRLEVQHHDVLELAEGEVVVLQHERQSSGVVLLNTSLEVEQVNLDHILNALPPG